MFFEPSQINLTTLGPGLVADASGSNIFKGREKQNYLFSLKYELFVESCKI